MFIYKSLQIYEVLLLPDSFLYLCIKNFFVKNPLTLKKCLYQVFLLPVFFISPL